MEKTTKEKTVTHLQIQKATSSRSTTRRTSGTSTREPLPTPPPDPRLMTANIPNSDDAVKYNIFQYPTITTTPATATELYSLPGVFQGLLQHAEREKEFYKNLNETISKDCKHASHQHYQQVANMKPDINKLPTAPNLQQKEQQQQQEQECHCSKIREECEQFINPLNGRLNASVTAALAAYGAVDQLTRLYSMWDRYIDVERQLKQRKECLRYANLLNEKARPIEKDAANVDTDLETSLALLDTILATGTNASLKRSQLKQQRERSKSVMIDDSHLSRAVDGKSTSSNLNPPLLRRQSTYSDCKSKVSKWTKVKAAFKWEKANVPALNEGGHRDMPNGIGLTPNNNEVARYLRVPSLPCGGGSSADSIFSSSSGHFLSETGTPGTVSSASSMDDIVNAERNTLRRDSSKSDSRSETIKLDDTQTTTAADSSFDLDNQKLLRSDSSKSATSTVPVAMSKSSSNKSFRKSKIVPDFEVLHEEKIAEIKSPPTRRLKPPPSPLDLNLRQDLLDLDYFCSPNLVKSPKDGTQSLNRLKKMSSPGNSSVPSSPSRHSDFFMEFESEDISSGDFSEPSSPTRKNFQQKQQEINQRYQILREKLDMEFAAKQREWEKIKTNPNSTRAIPILSNVTKSEEHSPNAAYDPNLSTKQLEENLTPDFKKKLKKWRVKKQASLQSCGPQPPIVVLPTVGSPGSPNKDTKDASCEVKAKIDWNLWKTGQIKLEGQGLKPLPDQKDLPEEFQKKLEQWNKIKRGGGTSASGDSLKRNSKHSESNKKSSDDDRAPDKDKRTDKHKAHEKDKLEKLSKLKAIVGDHPTKAKEIEVKTSVGVMKFEGISRKFTRKLYEWEKARGIGPESSTFALLHPGYCPIDVGRITKENIKNDNSPTLSRSLSLDSVSPNISLPVAVSHQASSLSLNDMNDLKSELDGVSSSDPLGENEFKKFDEPEAVMVEVEDDIVETASPLITANSRIEKQIPVYKYEEVACNDICNAKRIQSYESHTNLAPLLSALKRFDELFEVLKQASPEIAEKEEVRHCQATISLIRNIYPYYTENLTKPNVLHAISDVQSELSRLSELHQKSPLNEACCQEVLEERNKEYNEEFEGLRESLHLLRQIIQGGTNHYPRDMVPDINITTEDATNDDTSPPNTTSDTKSQRAQFSTSLDVTDDLSASQKENDTETTTTTTTQHTTVQRSFSNATTNGSIGKKRLRLRRLGSRQNSKTESSNSSDDDLHGALETPRRLKRKNFRYKQRSFDDDFRRSEEPNTKTEDVHYVLKVKPGHPIEQCESVGALDKHFRKAMLTSKENLKTFLLVVDTDTQRNDKLDDMKKAAETIPTNFHPLDNTNVFVKTKRKVFTTVEAPSASDGIAALAVDIDSGNSPLENKRQQRLVEIIPTTVTTVAQKHQSTEVEKSKVPDEETTRALKSAILKHKSLSQPDLRLPKHLIESFDERKSHSTESIKSKHNQQCVRQPLASDSFRVINKSCGGLAREDSNTQKRMELRFKKNPNLAFIQNPCLRKIETKIAKSNSGASVESAPLMLLTPSSTFSRQKLKSERNSLTPTLPDFKREFSYTLPTPQQSAPTTPLTEADSTNKPCTPLSERALRLRKAKADFLQGTMPRSKPSFKRRDEIIRSETWEQNRRSDQSLSSVTTIGGDDFNGTNLLMKTISSDTIRGEDGGGGGDSSVISFNSGMEDTQTQSDAGTDMDVAVGIYDSLPRTVTRSGKISSKLGFANLASKFRRTKIKGKSKDTSNSSDGGALTALCRQTLFADAIGVASHLQQDSVMKSQSTPQAGVSPNPAPTQTSHLNKSQSDQIVRISKKESYV